MAGHDRDFRARKNPLHLFQKFQSRHLGHDHVGQDDVRGLLLQQGQRHLAIRRFHAGKAHSLGDGHAQAANTLFVIHHHKTDFQIPCH